MATVPKEGLCISSFLIITEKNGPKNSVLVGRINPKADWDHIGAINPSRLERASKGWMLPSSHLLMRESPETSVKRIIREQLGIEDESKVHLNPQPIVFGDVGVNQHWDLGYIYTGSMAKEDLPKHSNTWVDLKFVDFDKAAKSDFVRLQNDVISYVV